MPFFMTLFLTIILLILKVFKLLRKIFENFVTRITTIDE